MQLCFRDIEYKISFIAICLFIFHILRNIIKRLFFLLDTKMVIKYTKKSKKRVYKMIVTSERTDAFESKETTDSKYYLSALLKNSFFSKHLPNASWCTKRLKRWFDEINLSHISKNFHNYNGSDILRLSKNDIYLICGELQGNLLINCLFPSLKNKEDKKQMVIRFPNCNYYNLMHVNTSDKNELISNLKNLLLAQCRPENPALINEHDEKFENNDEFHVCNSQLTISQVDDLDSVYKFDQNSKIMPFSAEQVSQEDKFVMYLINVKNEDIKQSILLVKE